MKKREKTPFLKNRWRMIVEITKDSLLYKIG